MIKVSLTDEFVGSFQLVQLPCQFFLLHFKLPVHLGQLFDILAHFFMFSMQTLDLLLYVDVVMLCILLVHLVGDHSNGEELFLQALLGNLFQFALVNMIGQH